STINADRVIDSQFSANTEVGCDWITENDQYGNWVGSTEGCHSVQHSFAGWMGTVLNSDIRNFDGSIGNAQSSVLTSSRLRAQRIQNSTLTSVTLRPQSGSVITHNKLDQSSRFESNYGNTSNIDLRFNYWGTTDFVNILDRVPAIFGTDSRL